MGLIDRYRRTLHRHLSPVPDLVRILMKRRSGEEWTETDRAFLKREMRAIARWTPAFFLLLLPGGLALLPVYAWLLDRREETRTPPLPPSEVRDPAQLNDAARRR